MTLRQLWDRRRQRASLAGFAEGASSATGQIIDDLLKVSRTREVTHAHLFLAVLQDSVVARTLSELGASVSAFVALASPAATLPGAPGIAAGVLRLFGAARDGVVWRRSPTLEPRDLLVTMAATLDMAPASYLADQRITYETLTYYLAHGVVESEVTLSPQDDPAARAALVMVNDEFTSMEYVVHCLMRDFKLEENDAIEKMLQVHTNGRAIVQKSTVGEAVEIARQANRRARAVHQPLRFMVESAA